MSVPPPRQEKREYILADTQISSVARHFEWEDGGGMNRVSSRPSISRGAWEDKDPGRSFGWHGIHLSLLDISGVAGSHKKHVVQA